jgi:hypothetical protein
MLERERLCGARRDFSLARDHKPDAWAILGIAPTRDSRRIRQAYLALARQHHPDQFRLDPARYHVQEERMKVINEAYHWALANPPESDAREAKSASTGDLIICAVHQRPATRQCRRCRNPICWACPGFRQSLCLRHYRLVQSHQARRRVIQEWGPLLALIATLRIIGWVGLEMTVVILVYLAGLGFRLLLTRRWFGCLALLLLPYSLIVAGVWSLVESVRDWHAPDRLGKAKP